MLLGFFLGCALTICSVVVLLILEIRVEKEPEIGLPYLDVRKILGWLAIGYYRTIIEPWFWLWDSLESLGDAHAKVYSGPTDSSGRRLSR